MNCQENTGHGTKCKDWACRFLKTLKTGTIVRLIVDGRFPIQASDGSDDLRLGCIDKDDCVTLVAVSNQEVFYVNCSDIRVVEIPSV